MCRLVPFLVLFVAALVLFRLALRPRFVIRLAGGVATVTRGQPPAALVRELEELARHDPGAAGEVRIGGRPGRIALTTPGLDDGQAQRVRNVVHLFGDRLG